MKNLIVLSFDLSSLFYSCDPYAKLEQPVTLDFSALSEPVLFMIGVDPNLISGKSILQGKQVQLVGVFDVKTNSLFTKFRFDNIIRTGGSLIGAYSGISDSYYFLSNGTPSMIQLKKDGTVGAEVNIAHVPAVMSNVSRDGYILVSHYAIE